MKSFTFMVRSALKGAGFHEVAPDTQEVGFFLSEKADLLPTVEVYFLGDERYRASTLAAYASALAVPGDKKFQAEVRGEGPWQHVTVRPAED